MAHRLKLAHRLIWKPKYPVGKRECVPQLMQMHSALGVTNCIENCTLKFNAQKLRWLSLQASVHSIALQTTTRATRGSHAFISIDNRLQYILCCTFGSGLPNTNTVQWNIRRSLPVELTLGHLQKPPTCSSPHTSGVSVVSVVIVCTADFSSTCIQCLHPLES